MALNAELVALKDALVAWLNFAKPPTVGQLSIKGELSSMPFENLLFCRVASRVRARKTSILAEMSKKAYTVPTQPI
jgi:hypothetical protein